MLSSSSFIVFGAAFLSAAGLVALLTPFVRLLALSLGVVARPKADRWHRSVVPLLGGFSVCAATVIPFMILTQFRPESWAAVIAGTAMCGLGLLDDLIDLKVSTKLLAEIGIACLLVGMGRHVAWTSSPLVNSLATILWFVGVMNAFNLIDNMDGLCAGVGAIAALAFVIGLGPGDGMRTYGVLLAGACAGFLVFNFGPASIFLGDAGSLFIGGTLAALVIGSAPGPGGAVSTLAIPVLVMLIPIFDTTFVTVFRRLSARPVFIGGRDHTSHRLVALGFSERQAVLLLYLLAALSGAVAIVFGRMETYQWVIGVSLLVLILVLLAVYLGHVRVYDGADLTVLRDKRYTPMLVDVTYKRRIFEVLLDVCLVTIAYYSAYAIRFDREFDKYYPLLLSSLPLVIACKVGSFYFAGVYRGVWRYLSFGDLWTFFKGLAMGSITSILALLYLYRFQNFSRGVFAIDAVGTGILVLGSRLSFRLFREMADRYRPGGAKALIYGAGDGGVMLVRELRNNHRYEYRVTGFIDDDPSKVGRKILGVPVLGTVENLESIITDRRPQFIIISSAKVADHQLKRIVQLCDDSGTALLQLDFKVRPVPRGTAVVN